MDCPKPSIAVVMSTYNGEAHLAEQLESVLAQDVSGTASLSVYVRDDGSVDGTVELLETYERQGRIVLLRGENLGVVGSFLAAIAAVPRSVDYIALCDQDDVWRKDKISRALAVLQGKDGSIPRLYWAEYEFCDADMRPLRRSRHDYCGVGFSTMLYEVMPSGNTQVMNRSLANIAIADGVRGVYKHDWWFALLASALGELAHDDFVSLDYRRTGSNESPTGATPWNLLCYRVQRFLAGDELRNVTAQLERLREAHGTELDERKRRLLDRMLDGGRIAKATVPVRLRQRIPDELALRLLFFIGKL